MPARAPLVVTGPSCPKTDQPTLCTFQSCCPHRPKSHTYGARPLPTTACRTSHSYHFACNRPPAHSPRVRRTRGKRPLDAQRGTLRLAAGPTNPTPFNRSPKPGIPCCQPPDDTSPALSDAPTQPYGCTTMVLQQHNSMYIRTQARAAACPGAVPVATLLHSVLLQ